MNFIGTPIGQATLLIVMMDIMVDGEGGELMEGLCDVISFRLLAGKKDCIVWALLDRFSTPQNECYNLINDCKFADKWNTPKFCTQINEWLNYLCTEF